MVQNILCFGSCNSRDIFNSSLNDGYKHYFKIVGDSFRASLISLMQPPFLFEENQIQSKDENNSLLKTRLLKEDLSKNFLKIMKQSQNSFLIMDNHYEVTLGLVELKDGSYITNSPDLLDSFLYDDLDINRVISIQKDTKEYLQLYKNSFEKFFEFINHECTNIQVILNVTRWCSDIQKDSGEIYSDKTFKKHAENHNKYRRLVDKLIMDNFDVDILPFDYTTLISEKYP